MSALLAFSMLNVSGFATSLMLVTSLFLIISASSSSLSRKSISLFITSLLGAGILASGWKIFAKPEKRPARPVSFLPMLPTSFGKYK